MWQSGSSSADLYSSLLLNQQPSPLVNAAAAAADRFARVRSKKVGICSRLPPGCSHSLPAPLLTIGVASPVAVRTVGSSVHDHCRESTDPPYYGAQTRSRPARMNGQHSRVGWVHPCPWNRHRASISAHEARRTMMHRLSEHMGSLQDRASVQEARHPNTHHAALQHRVRNVAVLTRRAAAHARTL